METKDILQIIRVCKTHGVHEFAFDKLRIIFTSPQQNLQQTTSLIPDHSPVKIPEKVEREMEAVRQEARQVEHRRELEDEIDVMVITDPLQYEENLANGEFVDEAQLQH